MVRPWGWGGSAAQAKNICAQAENLRFRPFLSYLMASEPRISGGLGVTRVRNGVGILIPCVPGPPARKRMTSGPVVAIVCVDQE